MFKEFCDEFGLTPCIGERGPFCLGLCCCGGGGGGGLRCVVGLVVIV